MNIHASIAKLRKALRPGGNLREHARRLMNHVPIDEYVNFVRLIGVEPQLRSLFLANSPLANYGDLANTNRFPESVKVDNVAAWSAATLRPDADRIRQFVRVEQELESAINHELWPEAVRLTNEADAKFGVSLWSLKIRICLIDRAHGVDEQKRFIRKFREINAVPLLRLIVFFMSSVAEGAQSADLFYDSVSKLLRPSIDEDRILQYVAFHVAFFGPFRFTKLAEVLDLERGNSIADRYLTFIRVGQVAFADPQHLSFAKQYRRALTLLADDFGDPRLVWLRSAYDVSAKAHLQQIDPDEIAPFDLYTQSRYRECLVSIQQCLRRGARPAHFIVLVARCLARLNEPPEEFQVYRDLYGRIDLLVALLGVEQGPAQGVAYLKKDIACFSSFNRAPVLHTFILQQTSPMTENLPSKYRRFADLAGSLANPRSVFAVGHTSRLVASTIAAAFRSSPAFALQHYSLERAQTGELPKELLGVPRERLAKFAAVSALASQDYAAALRYFEELSLSSDPMCRFDGIEGRCVVLTRTGELAEASRVLCQIAVKTPSTARRLPLKDLCDQVEKGQQCLPKRQMPIEIPNVFGLYSEHQRKDREYRMGTVCEDFLRSWQRERPSGLLDLVRTFDRKQLIFFLASVCTLSAIDSHPFYSTQKDVENERVEILRWLINLNPEARNVYASEIADIARRQAIRTAIQHVEKSKVSVNIAGVKSVIPPEAEETYVRFKSLPAFSLAQLEGLLKQLQQPTFNQVNAAAGNTLVVILPRSERSEVLASLYEMVRQRFIFSNDFGLDAYLSVGIRHSTLPGQLRSCFERWSLVTQKGKDGVYADNEFWGDRMSEQLVEPETRKVVQQALRKCSIAIDRLIGELRNELIQIKGDKHPRGLLFIDLTGPQLSELERAVAASASFASAVDLLIDLLWRQTDAALGHTRSVLRRDFRARVDSVLDELQQAMWVIRPSVPNELDSYITSTRTLFHDEIEAISGWFTRSDAAPTEDYDFALAVDIAKQMVTRCYAARSLEMEVVLEVKRSAKATTLHSLVNILFLLLDNALKHGAMENGCVALYLAVREDGNILMIETSNKISVAHDLNDVRSRVAAIGALIRSEVTPETVRAEGGSGLVKVAKILKVDLRAKHQLKLDVSEERDFLCAIEFDADVVLV